MNCLIPLWLTIIATNPCATWERFQAGFAVANGRMYTANHIVEPAHDITAFLPLPMELPRNASLDGSMGSLTYEEVEEPWIGIQGWAVHGEFSWPFAGTPRIKVALNSPLQPPWHELQHWIACVLLGKRTGACYDIGHGTDLDPIWNNTLRMYRAMMFPLPDTHSYFRKLSPVKVDWCEIKVDQEDL